MSKYFTPIWWVVGLRGLIAVLLGLGALFWPEQTLSLLLTLFGIYALVAGGLTLFGAFRNPEGRPPFPIIKGVVGVVVGLAVFLWSGITGVLLLYLIAGYSLISGVLDVGAAFRLQGAQMSLRPYMLGSGAAGIVFGILAIFQPGDGALGQHSLIGLYFVILGALGLFMAFRMWRSPAELATAPV